MGLLMSAKLANEKLTAKEVVLGKEFAVKCGGELRYRIKRDPIHWQVFDSNNNPIGQRDQYVNDIFDRLGCLSQVEYIQNWQEIVGKNPS